MAAANDGEGKRGQPLILLRFRQKKEFLDRFLPDVGIGGFQWDSAPRELGETIPFRFSFIGHSRRFDLTGKVVWRQSKPPTRRDLPPGVGIEFETSGRETLKELLAYASSDSAGDSLRASDDRRETRIGVNLDCEYLFQGELIREKVADISSAGLYIQTRKVLPQGTQFIFFLNDKQVLHPLVMEGKVVWARHGEPKAGFGVELVADSRANKLDVQRYVENLGESLDED